MRRSGSDVQLRRTRARFGVYPYALLTACMSCVSGAAGWGMDIYRTGHSPTHPTPLGGHQSVRHRSSRSRDLCPPLACGSRAPRGRNQRTNPLTGIRSARRSLSHLVILVCVLLSTLWSWSGLAGDNPPPRVLIISGFGDTLPAAGVARGAITKRLHETLHGKLEVFYDPLDFGQFPGQDYQDQITLFLAQKYAKKRPDVLIALELEIFALSVAHSRGDRTGSSHCLLLHVNCCSYFGNRLALARSNGRSQRERLDTNSCSCSSPSAQRS